MNPISKLITTGLLLSALAACSDNRQYETAICTLVDISGTYAEEKKNVVKTIKAGILSELLPGDSLFFVTIDSNSYNEENLKAKLTLDYRPSQADNQKLQFAKSLDVFASDPSSSKHTDVSGAMILCSEYLKSTQAGTQVMFVFSDMEEDLPKGVRRNFAKAEFDGIDITTLNVIKLAKDSSDPAVFRKRMNTWSDKVKSSGARSWGQIVDATKIPEFINQVK